MVLQIQMLEPLKWHNKQYHRKITLNTFDKDWQDLGTIRLKSYGYEAPQILWSFITIV